MSSVDDCAFEPLTAAPRLDSTEGRAKVFSALADPTRLSIVEALLTDGELSSTEIANKLDISLALLCHHSKVLTEAGVLILRRQGQTKFRSIDRALLKACFDSLQALDS